MKHTPEEESRLFDRHFGLVKSQVKQFRETSVLGSSDLEQVGAIGLLRAIRKFEPERGKFGSYARTMIRNALLNEVRRFSHNEEPLIGDMADEAATESFWEYLPALSQQEEVLVNLKLSNYTNEEISVMLDMTRESVRRRFQNIKEKIKEAN